MYGGIPKEVFSKKLIIADAFINTLTLKLHFNNKKLDYISNDYKDICNVYLYEHKHTFISILEQTVLDKQHDEIITCSFGTLSELYSVQKILNEHNIKVISITSDTTDDARKIIYKIFEETNTTKYDVILFSPTITVGVSILNNIKHHFHYDSGRSIDPISSVQMLKRSRSVENVHIFIKGEQQYFKSYSVDYLNTIVINNIKDYLNDVNNIIFYNVDNDSLSELGIFVNSFVAHSNFFSNGHKNTFKFLLTQQFRHIRIIDDDIKHKKFDQYVKEVTQANKTTELFNNVNVSNIGNTYDVTELRYLQNKNRDIDDDRELLFLEVKDSLPKLSKSEIFDITVSYSKDKQYLNKLNLLDIFINNFSIIDNIITNYALDNVSKIFSKHNSDDYISILKFMKTLNGVVLQQSYSKNDLKVLELKYKGFRTLLFRLGYKRVNSNIILTPEYKTHYNYILKSKNTVS